MRWRQIGEGDLGAVAALLLSGFPERSRDHWERGFARLRERPSFADHARYGYLMESGEAVVGVLLQLFTRDGAGEAQMFRCNVSSWYVDPAFRGHATMFARYAIRRKEVTYFNISPAPHTWPIVEAQGFICYSTGQFLAPCALQTGGRKGELHEVGAGAREPRENLTSAMPEAELLRDHAHYGCISVVCANAGEPQPFVFQPIAIRKGPLRLKGAQLVYCRSIADFTRFAGLLGRFLLRRGLHFVAVDAIGPVEGLRGVFRASRGRKYFKGPRPPRLGDLAYTEIVIFGP